MVMGPITEAKASAEAAKQQVPLAEEAYVDCFVAYAIAHSQAAATATEISEAATVACWSHLDHLRSVYYDARSKAARVAELERGTLRPDIAAGVDSDIKRLERMARSKALDVVVRARTPQQDQLPADYEQRN
jgi:hypothetical protein